MEQQLDNTHFTQEDKYWIGSKIQTLRIQHGWTLEDLSKVTGIDPRVISRHQNGELCGVESLVKYANAFHCLLEDLLPPEIACCIKGKTQEEQKYWVMMLGLTDSQKQIIFGMIAALAEKTA